MALIKRLINARVSVRRPDRSGPGGDVTSEEVVLTNRPAIRQVKRQQPSFDQGSRRENTLEAVFFLEPEDGLKIQRRDLIDWEVVEAGKVVDSGFDAEVREIDGLVGSQTRLAHFRLTAEV